MQLKFHQDMPDFMVLYCIIVKKFNFLNDMWGTMWRNRLVESLIRMLFYQKQIYGVLVLAIGFVK